MTYVALLRGINVGGNRKVDMKRLKVTFESCGFADVRTYINSGNVVFGSDSTDQRALVKTLERRSSPTSASPSRFCCATPRASTRFVEALPDCWSNDESAKCDVMFLAEEIDSPDILDQLTIKPDIDEVRYVPGAILWRVERPKATRSGMLKLVGTELYAQMTVRNCNTARKLGALVQ